MMKKLRLIVLWGCFLLSREMRIAENKIPCSSWPKKIKLRNISDFKTYPANNFAKQSSDQAHLFIKKKKIKFKEFYILLIKKLYDWNIQFHNFSLSNYPCSKYPVNTISAADFLYIFKV